MPTPGSQIPHSVLFQAPGRPLPGTRQRLARARIVECILAAAATRAWQLVDGHAEAATLTFAGATMVPGQLEEFLETTLNAAAASLDADLIGGANVTRLDQSIGCAHVRLPYRRALRIVNGRGWALPLGEEIPREAQATLIRFCGLRPVQLLMLPGQPRPARFDLDDAGSPSRTVCALLPLAGEVLRAQERGEPGSGALSCTVDLDRFMQYCLGLAEPDHR